MRNLENISHIAFGTVRQQLYVNANKYQSIKTFQNEKNVIILMGKTQIK